MSQKIIDYSIYYCMYVSSYIIYYLYLCIDKKQTKYLTN